MGRLRLKGVGFALACCTSSALGFALFPALIIDTKSPNYNTWVSSARIEFSETVLEPQIYSDVEWWIFDRTENLGVVQDLTVASTPFPKIQGTPTTKREASAITVEWVMQAGTGAQASQVFLSKLRGSLDQGELQALTQEVSDGRLSIAEFEFFSPEFRDLTPPTKSQALENVREIPGLRGKVAIVGGVVGIFSMLLFWNLRSFVFPGQLEAQLANHERAEVSDG